MLAYKNIAFLGVKRVMEKSKEYKRLLIFCLVVFILCDGTSFARGGGGRCGLPAGRRGGSFARRGMSRCGPPADRRGGSFARRGMSRCGPPADRRCGSFARRGINRCGPSRDRVVTCPQPQSVIIGFDYGYPYDYDGYYSRYDVLYPPPQVQSLQPQGNTYNYCTFNYFNGTEDSATQNDPPAYQRQLPQKTEVGIFYGDGVTAFKNGDYAEAAKNFQRAMRQANKFMPFAYVQALFADEDYTEATEQLRLALDKLSPKSDRILFPIFLYPSDQILLTQIEKLREQACSNSDLQLVIGYQLFGVKKMDEAAEFLNKAKSNSVNELAATKLLLIIKKTKTTTNRPQPPAHKTTSYT
jgi:hypothetical protein